MTLLPLRKHCTRPPSVPKGLALFKFKATMPVPSWGGLPRVTEHPASRLLLGHRPGRRTAAARLPGAPSAKHRAGTPRPGGREGWLGTRPRGTGAARGWAQTPGVLGHQAAQLRPWGEKRIIFSHGGPSTL